MVVAWYTKSKDTATPLMKRKNDIKAIAHPPSMQSRKENAQTQMKKKMMAAAPEAYARLQFRFSMIFPLSIVHGCMMMV
jgi:hypothetical protein